MLESLADAFFGLLWPLTRLVNMADPFSLPSLAGAAAFALAYGLAVRGRRSGPRLAAAARALLPSGVAAHPSTALDLKVYLVNGALFGTALGSWMLGSDLWRGWADAGLDWTFGPRGPPVVPAWAAQVLATLVGVVALDFGYYLAHWLAHHSAFLWRFHRPHHAAQVMTPLTGAREHPVDMLLFGNVIAACVGVGGAALDRALGGGASPYLLFQTNCLLFAYFLTLQHLRHSHVWLPLTGVWGCLLQSPAHHQIHHSSDPADHGANLGFALSIFDTLFGTLRLPRRHERLRFGLAEQADAHDLRAFYFAPFEAAREPPPPHTGHAADRRPEPEPRTDPAARGRAS